jgi:hypothetical protein
LTRKIEECPSGMRESRAPSVFSRRNGHKLPLAAWQLAAIGLFVCLTHVAAAQVIEGHMRGADSATTVPGIVVLAIDSAGRIAARSLSDADGLYVLRAVPGRYRVRALRIGYTPSETVAIDLAAGETRRIDLILRSLPVVLPTVAIDGHATCLSRAAAADAVQLWEQARIALAATSLSEEGASLDIDAIRIEGTEDRLGNAALDVAGPIGPKGTHPQIDSSQARETIGTALFASTPAETLAVAGYARPRPGGGIVFDAPSAEAMLSDAFAAAHCFHVEHPPNGHADWVGLGFRPVADVGTKADIAGTLWLDRGTAELRRLDFAYTNLLYYPSSLCDPSKAGACNEIGGSYGTGGTLDFVRLGSGDWLIDRWLIRTPPEEAPLRYTGTRLRRTPTGSEICYEGAGCNPLYAPIPRINLNFGSIASVSRDGKSIFRDTATIVAMERIAAKQAGKKPAHMSGYVADPDGHPLARVILETDNPARAAITNDSGYFELRTLPAKPITLVIRKAGYDPIRVRVPLLPDSTRHIRVELVPNRASPSTPAPTPDVPYSTLQKSRLTSNEKVHRPPRPTPRATSNRARLNGSR